MPDLRPGTPTSATPPDDRLDSWKEIAAHFNRDITTVQRWEKREGMPVHRHAHDKKGSVYAYRAELNAWTRSRNIPPPDAAADSPANAVATAGMDRGRRGRLLVLAALAVVVLLAAAAVLYVQRRELLWRDPLAGARFQEVTDWDGVEEAAAVSRDGRLVAFASDRDGRMDVWVTYIGSGHFHNLTHGTAPELVNPSVRTLGFSPDGALVTFWVRRPGSSRSAQIGIWAVPTLGGEPRPYLEGAAEYDWSSDERRLAYHTPGPGDPLFVTSGEMQPPAQAVFTAAAGLHSHFPLWSRDGRFIYFVQGALPDKLDIWRIPSGGGAPERITSHNSRVSHPQLLDARTLLYLAMDADDAGARLYSMDVERRIPHRLTTDLERYTSLSVSADGRRVVVTVATPKTTLWRTSIGDSSQPASEPVRISLTTSTGFAPRLAAGYLIYATSTGDTESIWKLADGASTELWRGPRTRIAGGPAISADGRAIAFSARQDGRTRLYVMDADGTNLRALTDALDLQGGPSWAPDGRSIAIAAAERGTPRITRVPLDGGVPVRLVRDESFDPVWAPDGRELFFSGPDIGTTFVVNAMKTDGSQPVHRLTLTRGARRLVFLPGGRALAFLRGDIRHKDVWLLDLQTGAERPLTKLQFDFDIQDFDLSPDGRELVLQRVQNRSDVALLDLAER